MENAKLLVDALIVKALVQGRVDVAKAIAAHRPQNAQRRWHERRVA
jgi:hypothetical protein